MEKSLGSPGAAVSISRLTNCRRYVGLPAQGPMDAETKNPAHRRVLILVGHNFGFRNQRTPHHVKVVLLTNWLCACNGRELLRTARTLSSIKLLINSGINTVYLPRLMCDLGKQWALF